MLSIEKEEDLIEDLEIIIIEVDIIILEDIINQDKDLDLEEQEEDLEVDLEEEEDINLIKKKMIVQVIISLTKIIKEFNIKNK